MQISKKCSIAVHCLIFIHEYGTSKKVTSELLALSTGCNPVMIRSILSALKKAGILSIRSGTGGATLKLPPAKITLYQVNEAVEPESLRHLMGIHTSPSPLCPVGKNIRQVLDDTYEVLRKDMALSLKSITLQQILDRYHEAAPAEEGNPGAAAQ